jgi:ArsR family transcriptional regulator
VSIAVCGIRGSIRIPLFFALHIHNKNCICFIVAKDQTAQSLERVLDALADPLRARILTLLAEYEVCVCYLVEVLHTVQPVVSRQLAALRQAGLVRAEREGKWIHYSLSSPKNESAAALLAEALRHLKQLNRTQVDLAKLATCAKRKTGHLKDAPSPKPIKW